MTAAPELGQLQLLDLSKIQVSPLNPRTDVGDLTELAASIGQIGVLEPIVVVQRNGHYEAVTGSRRAAASRLAGETRIPARIMSMDEATQAAAALIENLQRKDLTPLEEAEAFRKYLQLTGVTQAELGKRVARAPSTIANALRLLEAPKVVKDALAAGTITAAHARVALSVPAEVASKLPLRKGVTVHDLEDAANEITVEYRVHKEIRELIAKVKATGTFEVTWAAGEEWFGQIRVNLTKLLGAPPKKIAGKISGTVQVPPYYYEQGHAPTHDAACDCRWVAPGRGDSSDRAQGGVERVCVSAAGYKKYQAALGKKHGRSAKTGRKVPAQTAAGREKARKKKVDAAKREAASALTGMAGYRKVDLKVQAAFIKGGIDKEPARLVLFALVTARSHAWAEGWRARLWESIARMPIKQVRDRAASWAAASTLMEIGNRRDEKAELTTMIFEHFKVAIPAEPKKKAKR